MPYAAGLLWMLELFCVLTLGENQKLQKYMDVAKKEEEPTHLALLDKGGIQGTGRCTAPCLHCTGMWVQEKITLQNTCSLLTSIPAKHFPVSHTPWGSSHSTALDLFAELPSNAPL